MKPSIKLYHYSNAGRRKENQDRVISIYNKKTRIGLIGVADGMGGYQGGDTAAEIAIHTLKEMIESVPFRENRHLDNRNAIKTFIQKANNKIYNLSQKKSTNETDFDMGSTCTGVLIVGESFYVFNVGDSRTYRVKESGIEQLTIDHTASKNNSEEKIFNAAEKLENPYSNILSRALGTNNEIDVDIFPRKEETAFSLEENVVLFSCSDGLWGKVTSNEIFDEITGRKKIKGSIKNLTALAFSKNSTDNISAAAVEWGKIKRKKIIKKKYPAIKQSFESQEKIKRRLRWIIFALVVTLIALVLMLAYLLR
jgi:protein phosphatase